jgi:dihydrodipicolinate synthase/N-acetylneuraminate lyase
MSKLGGALFSGILGWWGPHGLFMTPVQIYRNVQGILSGPDPRAPSRQLKEHVRGQLVREFLAEQRQSGPDA